MLFGAALRDDHPQEYGRNGQDQRGIDILLRRDNSPDYFVGVQCRKIVRPIKREKIEADARAALTHTASMKELIFATTAPDDSHATDAALAVERKLRAEGHDLRIVVYGWGQLQLLIAQHDVAYSAFHPAAFATHAPQSNFGAAEQLAFAELVAQKVREQTTAAVTLVPGEPTSRSPTEDPVLHAKIDTYRDLLKTENEPVIAERLLLALLDGDLRTKPWAHYRILTNLGVVALELGRHAAAAERFEAAFAVLPDDSDAKANLALARTIQGRFAEAMSLAREALDARPRSDAAVSYLLQAASRSDWDGDPYDLIPEELRASPHAALGLAEFYRRKAPTGWQAKVLEVTEPHAEDNEFRPVRAIAILSLAVESEDMIAGGIGPVTTQQLQTSARDMVRVVEELLRLGYDDRHDFMAHVNNAAMLLRLCEDYEAAQALLLRTIPLLGDEPQLRRLLALSQLNLDRYDEATETLKDDPDPENRLFRAQVLAHVGQLQASLEGATAVADEDLDERLLLLKWRIVGEVALKVDDRALVSEAVNKLRDHEADAVGSRLLEIRLERLKKGVSGHKAFQEALRDLASSLAPTLEMIPRYFLAESLASEDLSEEASLVLDGHVDLSRPNPAASLYLRALAEARRDGVFRKVVADAAPELRESPGTQWVIASHAWNVGDLAAAAIAVEKVLSAEPNHPRARLLKAEILIRQDRAEAARAELAKPIEDLDWDGRREIYRIASLLVHFGFAERSAALAYRLFLGHRDESRAWLTLSMLILEEGRGTSQARRWLVDTVGPDAAVDVQYEDGESLFFVIEPTPELRQLDVDSWEPSHPLAKAAMGLRAGDDFLGPDGRPATIKQVRHKYVARLHYVLEHHAARFPEKAAFWKIEIDPEAAGGLDALIAQTKARHDWLADEEEQYLRGNQPLTVLAKRAGTDVIDTALGIAARGKKLQVAKGNGIERRNADSAIRRNARNGCVLDLLTFWTVWRLDALDAVIGEAGTIHVPQSLVDGLRHRRERLAPSAVDGLMMAGYSDGRLEISETSAEVIGHHLQDLDRALAWLERFAKISPIVAGEDLHPDVRQALRAGVTDFYDSVVIALQGGLLLVSDDVITRQVSAALGGDGGTWLHNLFTVAARRRTLDLNTYVRWSAYLIEAGQYYISLTGAALEAAAEVDGGTGDTRLLSTLSTALGGKDADAASHLSVALECIGQLWAKARHTPYREQATSQLLTRLIFERMDYAELLRALLAALPHSAFNLRRYVHQWIRGHFLRI